MANSPLSLLEREEFEDWLNMSGIIRKLNIHFEEPCQSLNREFARIFELSSTANCNPISPTVLCDSFRENIQEFNLSNALNSTFYHSLEKILHQNAAAFYAEAVELLLQYGPADAIIPPSHPDQLNKAVDTLTNQSQHLPVAENQRQAQALLPKDRQSADEITYTAEKNLQPISQITSKLLSILHETHAVSPEKLANNPQPDEINPAAWYSAEDIVKAIAKIQRAPCDNSSLHLDSTALNQELQHTLDSLAKGEKLLSKKDTQQLEIYGKFFETLFNDFEFSADFKSYLEKLHLPLLSLPLQGDEFLDNDLHPARAILNQLATLETAVKGNKTIGQIKVKDAIDELIERIVQQAGTNPSVYKEVEEELGKITQRVVKSSHSRIKRIIAGEEEQQKHDRVNLAFQQTIDQQLASRTIPPILSLLLKSGWQQLLINAEINKEKHPDEQQKYRAVIDDLLFWLYEQDSVRKMQSSSIRKTLGFIEDKLKSVCTDTALRRSITAELNALLLGIGTPKIISRVEISKIAPETQADQSPEDIWTLQVEQLQVDEWLMISVGSAGFEPMKLVWIGDVVQVYVFINRDSLHTLKLSKSELASLLRSGAAHQIENLDMPLMDRATNLMLQKMQEELIHNATHDAVTNLLSRDELIRQLKHEMHKLDNSIHTFCHLEVMDFRMITNICGVDGSEELLKKLVGKIAERLRSDDLFARLGQKAFAILFKHCTTEEGHEKAKQLMKLIGESRFQWQENSFALSISMGLAPFMDAYLDVQQLLQQADSASISAERSSQNRILLFSHENENLTRQTALYKWIGHIDDIFSQNRLFVRCQMIAPIEPENVDHLHYEILLGIKDEAGNIIPPDQFIPAVERCKRMPEIDQWIIDNVFIWIENNRDDFDRMDGFSINLSGQSINSEAFLEYLKEALESRNVPAKNLTFEITETVASENLVFTKRFIKTIKQFGCKFSLDDFGSGYSSYAYLKNLNVDYLKIDGAFVKDIVNNKADMAIVKSMNEIAHSLGLKTIAEYVENNEIRDILRKIGVDYGQGYGIHKPIPLTELVIPTSSSAAPTYYFEDESFWEL